MSSATVTLRVFSGGQCVATHRVARDIVKIGRLSTSHLRLDNDAIARMHAVLEVNGTDVRLVDLGSATGTMVNGAAVDRSTAIQPGDRIELGPYTVFVDMDAPALAARPSDAAVASPAHEHVDAPAVAQVVARWNDRIVDVQHLGHAPKRRVDSIAWLALGALLTAGGAAAFASELGQDWSSHQEQVRAAAEAGAPAPAQPGYGVGGLGLMLAFAGLVPLGLGIVGRRDRVSTSYVLGDGPDASLTMAGDALPQAHTLVRRDDRGVVLSVSPAMHGHVDAGGVRHDLRELVARGGSSEIALQTGATARVELGAVTFDVAAVAPGRVIAGRSQTDKTYWIYNAASFAVIGGMLGLSQLIPDDALAMGIDENEADNRFVGYLHQPDEEKPAADEPVEDGPTDSESKAGLSGERHAGTEGAMGRPDRPNVRKMYASKGPKDAVPMLARNFDPDLSARNAGILGMAQLEAGHFLASPHGGAFAIGNDDEDLWGNIQGDAIGESGGAAGLGLVGTGRGGGGEGEGTVGLTGVGTIGQSGNNGDRLGYGNRNGRDSGTAFDGRKSKKPIIRMPAGDFHGVLDKELIRRVVRAHLNEVRGCYDQGLARDPNLRGRVEIQFAIGPTGAVSSSVVSETSVDDEQVGRCIAKAVRRWRFPTNAIGGSAMVSYPFQLQTGG
jgi:hypothetical protein